MSRVILLADDSVTIQKVIELTFMDEDYQVVSVSNGDEALEKLSEITPQFVIADVHMPGADGYAVCRRAKEAYPGVPVLLLVGTFEPFDETEAEAAGADAFLKKPFDSQELLRLVQDLQRSAASAEASPPPAAPPQSEEEEGELEAWDQVEIADDEGEGEAEVKAPEEAPEPVWSNLEESLEATVAEPIPAAARQREEGPVEPASEAVAEPPPAAEPSSPAAVGEPARDEAPVAKAEEEATTHPEPELPAVGGLSDEDVDRIARRVAELVGEKVVRDVAWEVVPDLAELHIRRRLEELESQLEGQVES